MQDNTVTTDRMLEGLKIISNMQKPIPELFSQIFGFLGKSPILLPAKPIDTTFKGMSIYSNQIEAIEMAIRSRLSIIQGPPGSGKTIVSAIIVKNYYNIYKKQVLVCAPSNIAVANLAEKIGCTGLKVFFSYHYLGCENVC